MKAVRYLPCDALKPFIKAFLLLGSGDGMQNLLLPDTSLVAAFRLRGEVEQAGEQLPLSVITGLRRSAREVSYAKESAMLLVQFHDGGAAAFTRLPMHELFNASVPLDQIFAPQEIRDLETQLATAQHDAQRIAFAERFFLSKLRLSQPDLRIRSAIAQIRSTGGDISITALAQSACLSQDAFEKKFRSHVGASPKRFAATVRFREMLSRYTPELSLTRLAYLGGYFDQSHFIRDFRSFTGRAPHEFFLSSRYW